MRLIQANCRVQFTAEDIQFIVQALGKKNRDNSCLIQLLADEESRDQILDDDALFQAVLENRGCLKVSDHLYFYVLVRRVLRRAGIEDRAVADYIAEILAEFSRLDHSRCLLPGQSQALEDFFEMLTAVQRADDRTRFFLRAHIGNYSLFLSGVFLERIRYRAEAKGFPGVQYYEGLGRANYRAASDHRLAERYSLGPIFATLADEFQTARLALNDAAQRLFSLGEADYGLDSLLQAQFGRS